MSNQIIDLKKAAKLVGGDPDFAKEIICDLIKSLPEYQHDIDEAFNQHDFKALAFKAHKLKGASAYTGTVKLCHAAELLEASSRNENDKATTAAFKQLIHEIDATKKAANEINFKKSA